MGKHLLTFLSSVQAPKCCCYFLNSVLDFLLFFFLVGFAELTQSIKTVKLWSSTLLRGHKSINLSVLKSNKVAFVMHESQKVASILFMIRNFIYHSLKFIRLLRVVFSSPLTEGVITTRSNRMKFRLYLSPLKCIYYFFVSGTN